MNHGTSFNARAIPRIGVVALLAALIVTGAVRATPALAAAPTVTGLSPSSGSTSGGYSVVITGTGFTAGSTVTVGGTAVNVTFGGATQLTIISMPPHTAGTVDVIVTTPGEGSSTNTAADDFTYIQAPTVSGLSPTSGPVGARMVPPKLTEFAPVKPRPVRVTVLPPASTPSPMTTSTSMSRWSRAFRLPAAPRSARAVRGVGDGDIDLASGVGGRSHRDGRVVHDAGTPSPSLASASLAPSP